MASSHSNTDDTLKSTIRSSDSDETIQFKLIRPCDRYEDEYTECKSAKSRRQQIFVHGQTIDCETWAKDLANCKKWTWAGDEEAAMAVIDSERRRLRQRLIPHMKSDVWSKRNGPPPDWNNPLPEFEELNKNSYLTRVKETGW